MTNRRRRIVGVVLVATQLAGCSSWRVEQVGPEQLVRERAPAQVRVVRGDGSGLVLDRPKISGDSLTGLSGGAHRGVPLADVNTIATRHGDAAKSILLGVGIAGGIFAIAAAAASSACYLSCH